MKKFFILFILTVGVNNINSMSIIDKINQALADPTTYNRVVLFFNSPEKREYYLNHIDVPCGFSNPTFGVRNFTNHSDYYIQWHVNHIKKIWIKVLLDIAESSRLNQIEANEAKPSSMGLVPD